MKLAATLTIDFDLPDERVQGRYGSLDPYTVCRAMEAEFADSMRDDSLPENVTRLDAQVRPVYG